MLSSCSAYKMTIDVWEPPEVRLPENVKKVAVLNRLGQAEEQDIDHLVTGIFTGRGTYVHRIGARQAINGLLEYLNYSREFDELIRVNVMLNDTGHRAMPEAVSPELIRLTNQNYQADALIVLEYFNSANRSFIETRREREKERKDKVWSNTMLYNVGISESFVGILEVKLEVGWRTYNARDLDILDEHVITDSVYWEADGKTRSEAGSRLPNRSRAVEEAGFIAGENYAIRIVPGWSTVSRIFLLKGNKFYPEVRKLLKRRQWGRLAETWETGLEHTDPLIRSVALHNLAILYEMEGNIEKAMEYLEKANDLSRSHRIANYIEKVKERQME